MAFDVTASNTTLLNTTTSFETTSNPQPNSSFRVDRWDWSTWNTMSGLALWITNTGTQPLDIFSLSVTIGGLPPQNTLYPGPPQTCPLNPISSQSQCLFMPTPSFSPTAGNSYGVLIISSDGTQLSLNATYDRRSESPQGFAIQAVSWAPDCCNYVLNIRVMDTGGVAIDTNQVAALITLNGNSPTLRNACGVIVQTQSCDLTLQVDTFTSYIVVVTDSSTGFQIYILTPG